MPILHLTKRTVDTAAPERMPDGKLRRTIYFDTATKGFGLLVTETGSKSFVVKYRAGKGRVAPTRRVTIGRYGSPWTVETARAEAKRLLGAVAHGADPAADRAEERSGRSRPRTVAGVVEQWLQRDQAKNRSVGSVIRIMHRHVLPTLGSKAIDDVRKSDLLDLIDKIADQTPVAANRALAHLKRFFRWAAARDIIEMDPAAHVLKPTAERRRERVLTDDELRAVWLAAERVAGPFGDGVRLLITTGARRDEVFRAKWAEIDLSANTLNLPPERNKVNHSRSIALSPLALSILHKAPRVGDYVLTTRGYTSFSGFGKCKSRLDELAGVSGWRLHDLRRTVATGLQRLGVRLEVIEAVLGHVSGSRSGIVGVYQRHRFEAEAREALTAWGAHIERLVTGAKGAEVVPLRRTR